MPPTLQSSVERIQENCEPALCTVLFMGGAGGSLAAPIWGDMIAQYSQRRSSGEWNLPAGLVAVDFDRDQLAPLIFRIC